MTDKTETPPSIYGQILTSVEEQLRELTHPEPDFEEADVYDARMQLSRLDPDALAMLMACIGKGISETSQFIPAEVSASEALHAAGNAISGLNVHISGVLY